jgi:hypothetical protein
VWVGFPLLGVPYWTAGVNVYGIESDMAFVIYDNSPPVPTLDTTWSAIKALYR